MKNSIINHNDKLAKFNRLVSTGKLKSGDLKDFLNGKTKFN